jgi:hypothetical protein
MNQLEILKLIALLCAPESYKGMKCNQEMIKCYESYLESTILGKEPVKPLDQIMTDCVMNYGKGD